MAITEDKYTCINCGNKINALYKKYSSSVLKLSSCETCNDVADKYVEYDPLIIIIDLVLLSKESYRHILYNTDFKIHWKLAIMFQIMEAYSEYVLSSPTNLSKNARNIQINYFESDDLLFYKTCLKVFTKTVFFVLTLCAFTLIYKYSKRETPNDLSLKNIWKASTLSNFGILLLLPSIIWNGNAVQDFHIAFVSLYTTLSQLLAYTVVCQCPKYWSIIVIVVSNYCRINSLDIYNRLSCCVYDCSLNNTFTDEISFVNNYVQ